MKNIKVRTASKHYSILVGERLLERLGSLVRPFYPSGKIFVITQKKIARLFLKKIRRSFDKQHNFFIYELPDGETAKSSQSLFQIYRALVRAGIERRGLILAVGGGVVGDLAGFAAATYLRGIRFVNVGTTLLSQVDSAIGGKTGINLKEGKNLVGAFYQPELVICDIRALKTLPERELRASLAEVVKYGVIRSAKLFHFLESHAQRILKKESTSLEMVITESARIKAEVVSRDEFEIKGERMILNFGHTFGHGFEQATGYKKLLHGEAVSIGMLCAARLAGRLKMFPAQDEKRLLQLLQAFELPTRLPERLKISKILEAMNRDKKKSGTLHFVLPVKIGKVEIRKDIPLSLVGEVIREVGGY